MIEALGQVLAFLAEHADLVTALYKAIASGASKDSIKAAIESAEVTASDEVMREELGLQPK